MIGAIAGDIIGSVYEHHPIKTTDFQLFDPRCRFTDDTVLTVALADAILNDRPYDTLMKSYYQRYPHAGYGGAFHHWAVTTHSVPYNSWGNGAAMRISPVGFAYDDLDTVLARAAKFTALTHSHPEGIKGGQATAAAIFMARHQASKADIKAFIQERFDYDLNRTCDDIRPSYRFDVSCQGTVPEAIIAFLDSTSYETAVRLAVSLGGDADTLACITGGIAQAFYGDIPDDIRRRTMAILDDDLRQVTAQFMQTFCS